MHAPLYSTFALIAEIFVSTAVFYTFYQGYKHNRFPEKVAIGALVYEILFNISYMAYRVPTHHETTPDPAWQIALAAFHGILSLLMFIGLVLFFVVALRQYRKDVNYFKDHKRLTITFLCFWTVSVVSGIVFYFVEYGL